MAIVTVNQETKIKLVYQVQDEEGGEYYYTIQSDL